MSWKQAYDQTLSFASQDGFGRTLIFPATSGLRWMIDTLVATAVALTAGPKGSVDVNVVFISADGLMSTSVPFRLEMVNVPSHLMLSDLGLIGVVGGEVDVTMNINQFANRARISCTAGAYLIS